MSGPTEFGFDWGPVCVERTVHLEGRGYIVTVRPVGNREKRVEVYVSEQGRSVRVFTRGRVRVKQGEGQ